MTENTVSPTQRNAANQSTPSGAARSVSSIKRGSLDIRALLLLAILLAAGFILNFTLGKAIAGSTGGLIGPEFIITAFCITILVVRPNVGQALVIGLISAAVIQATTASPFIDFAAEGIAAMFMAVVVRLGMKGSFAKFVPLVGTFVTTVLSGLIFMVIKMALISASGVAELAFAMLPVIFATAAFNAVLVQILYLPIRKALKLAD